MEALDNHGLYVNALIMRLLRMHRELFIQGKYVSLWGERGVEWAMEE